MKATQGKRVFNTPFGADSSADSTQINFNGSGAVSSHE
jgi:hypothetical protein